MKNLVCGLLILAFSQVSYAYIGDKGNGGDILKCKENGQTVYRTLDSVITKDQPFFERKNYDSTAEALASITAHFAKTLPHIGLQLKDFINTFEKKRNNEKSIFWIKTKLQQISDERLVVMVPENCEENPIQAVILVKEGIKRYYYDPVNLDRISPVDDELSWMLIHEFLRDFLDDADIIRIVNAYIHSQDFLNDTDLGVKNQLIKLGINNGAGTTYSEHQERIAKGKENLARFYRMEKLLAKILLIDLSKLSRREKKKLIVELRTLGITNTAIGEIDSVIKYFDINIDIFYARVIKHRDQITDLIKKLD